MKTLYIVRHAKADLNMIGVDDLQRQLTETGKQAAIQMSKKLHENNINPDLILSSPAARAYATAKQICKYLNYDEGNIKIEKFLYNADYKTLLSIVNKIEKQKNNVMLIGHNPGMSDFVNRIEVNEVGSLPTCAVYAVKFVVDDWSHITFGSGDFLFYYYP